MKQIIVALFVSIASLSPFGVAVADTDSLGIDLADYLSELRKQFIDLKKQKESKELPMYFDKISVELSLVTKKEVKAGTKFYVISADGKYDNAATQKLKFDIWLGGKPGVGGIASNDLNDIIDDTVAYIPIRPQLYRNLGGLHLYPRQYLGSAQRGGVDLSADVDRLREEADVTKETAKAKTP